MGHGSSRAALTPTSRTRPTCGEIARPCSTTPSSFSEVRRFGRKQLDADRLPAFAKSLTRGCRGRCGLYRRRCKCHYFPCNGMRCSGRGDCGDVLSHVPRVSAVTESPDDMLSASFLGDWRLYRKRDRGRFSLVIGRGKHHRAAVPPPPHSSNLLGRRNPVGRLLSRRSGAAHPPRHRARQKAVWGTALVCATTKLRSPRRTGTWICRICPQTRCRRH
jgi:hypothetical protein